MFHACGTDSKIAGHRHVTGSNPVRRSGVREQGIMFVVLAAIISIWYGNGSNPALTPIFGYGHSTGRYGLGKGVL